MHSRDDYAVPVWRVRNNVARTGNDRCVTARRQRFLPRKMIAERCVIGGETVGARCRVKLWSEEEKSRTSSEDPVTVQTRYADLLQYCVYHLGSLLHRGSVG